MVGMANVVFREYIKKRKKGKWYIFLSIKVGFQFYSKKKKKVGFQYSRALIYNLNLPPSIIELKKEKKKKVGFHFSTLLESPRQYLCVY